MAQWDEDDVRNLAEALSKHFTGKCWVFDDKQRGALQVTGTVVYWAGKAAIGGLAIAGISGIGTLLWLGIKALIQALAS